MSLRRRMVLFTGAAVALAVALSAVACYVAVESNLHSRLDRQLETFVGGIAAVVAHSPALGRPRKSSAFVRRLPGPGLQAGGDAAIFDGAGAVYRTPEDHTRFRLGAHDLAVARGATPAYFRTARVGHTEVRVYVAPAGSGRAVVGEQSLSDLKSTLHDLALILTAITVAGVALAALLGLLVARTATAPVHMLRQAAEHVGSTGDLSRRIDTIGEDDLGRLGESFNSMLAALEDSQRAQRQLIGDASHELRTPVASLRTNLEVLIRNPDLDLTDRTPLLEDLVEQSAELGALVEDLLESARNGDDAGAVEPLALDQLIRIEIERCASRHPNPRFDEQLEPCVVIGRESRLRRAVKNLLDNAVKWSPPGAAIEVKLLAGELSVRDHGPGFSEDDLPHVFDRFYRSPVARSIAGSGLGLSIVRKVANEHGGSALARNADGGGALVTLTLAPEPADREASGNIRAPA